MGTLAVDLTVVVVGGAGAVAAVVFLLVVIAPWRSIREEGPLSEEIETRLLLGEDPDEIAADVDADDARRAPVHDLGHAAGTTDDRAEA